MSKNRLASMPFSVLLPKAGDITTLASQREFLEERLTDLRERGTGGTQVDIQSRLGEESMILQVLQWMTMGEDSDG